MVVAFCKENVGMTVVSRFLTCIFYDFTGFPVGGDERSTMLAVPQ